MESIRRHEHYLALRLGLKPGALSVLLCVTFSVASSNGWITMAAGGSVAAD
jgi:hypothetical protein